MDLLVGVDLGTTACKVTVVASDLTASTISRRLTRSLHPIATGLNKIRYAWGEAVDANGSGRSTAWVRARMIM